MTRSTKFRVLTVLLLSTTAWGQTAAGQNEAVSATPDVALGRPLEFVKPNYPEDAAKGKLEGSVALTLTIDSQGNVTDISAISSGAEFTDAAVKAARQWKYLPQPLDGTNRENITTTVNVHFGITVDGKPNLTVTFEEPKTPSERAIFQVAKDVTPPQAVYSPTPQYDEQAGRDVYALHASTPQYNEQPGRPAYQGTCALSTIVGPDGVPRNIHVVKSLGMGLDEKAIETVKNWKFAPAIKDGKPVAVFISVEVTFRLFTNK